LPRSIELVCDKPLGESSTWCPECYANEFVKEGKKMKTYEVIKIAGFWINSDNPTPSDVDSNNYDPLVHQFIVLNSGDGEDYDNEDIFFWSNETTREEFYEVHGAGTWIREGSQLDWEWVCTDISPEKFTWSESDGLCMVYDV